MAHDDLFIELAHPHPLVNIGMSALLAGRPGVSVSPSLSPPSPPRAPGRACVITDYEGGLALARAPSAHRAAILVLTDRDKEYQVRAALRHGVDGYLLHGCCLDELHAAIGQLCAGRTYLAQALRARLEELAQAAAPTTRRLTRRESDILALLSRGDCNKSIARELGITPGTVKSHLKVVFHKLGAKGRTHAVVLAAERGLTF